MVGGRKGGAPPPLAIAHETIAAIGSSRGIASPAASFDLAAVAALSPSSMAASISPFESSRWSCRARTSPKRSRIALLPNCISAPQLAQPSRMSCEDSSGESIGKQKLSACRASSRGWKEQSSAPSRCAKADASRAWASVHPMPRAQWDDAIGDADGDGGLVGSIRGGSRISGTGSERQWLGIGAMLTISKSVSGASAGDQSRSWEIWAGEKGGAPVCSSRRSERWTCDSLVRFLSRHLRDLVCRSPQGMLTPFFPPSVPWTTSVFPSFVPWTTGGMGAFSRPGETEGSTRISPPFHPQRASPPLPKPSPQPPCAEQPEGGGGGEGQRSFPQSQLQKRSVRIRRRSSAGEGS